MSSTGPRKITTSALASRPIPMRSQTHFGFIPCWVYDSLGSPRDFYNALIPNLFWVSPSSGLKLDPSDGLAVVKLVTKSVFTNKYDRFRLLMVEARKACGLTQAMLAQKLSRPQSFVSKYERGERRLDLVEFLEIARAIGIDALEFIKRLDDL